MDSPENKMNYAVKDRITPEDKEILKVAFGDEKVFGILKKIIIPSYADESTPFEMTGADVWLMGRDWSSMPVEEIKALVVAREDTIKYFGGALTYIKTIVNETEETPQNREARRAKDSTK